MQLHYYNYSIIDPILIRSTNSLSNYFKPFASNAQKYLFFKAYLIVWYVPNID